MNKKALIIVIIVVIVAAAGAAVLFMGSDDSNSNSNTVVLNLNTNANTAIDENTNADTNENTNSTSAATNDEVVTTGMVFLKGYNTPSESYGVLTSAGHEIGLGKYDSMKEQFRAYIGEKVKVTFENVCRTTNDNCCRTLFPYCGTVTTWEPVENGDATETTENTNTTE